MEDFDMGGENVSYHELMDSNNVGGAYRNTPVDIAAHPREPGYYVGWLRIALDSDPTGSGIGNADWVRLVPTPPAAPSGLSVSGEAWVDGVTFTWADNATNEDSYLIEWSSATSDGWHVIDELPAGSTSYTDEYPVIAADNHYRVVAVRNGDPPVESAPSNDLSAYPKAPAVAWYDNNGGANERGTLSPFATVHDQAVTINVLPNDVDYDAGTFSISQVNQPGHGTAVLNTDGTITYTPNPGFVGTDTFTYKINDGTIDSPQATVAIDVTNAAPVAQSRAYDYGLEDRNRASGTDGDGRFDVMKRSDVLAGSDADGDALTYRITDTPKFGAMQIDLTTGEFTYTPASSFNGYDRFTYVANDGFADSLPATVTLTAFSGDSPLRGVEGAGYANSVWNPYTQQWDGDAWWFKTPPDYQYDRNDSSFQVQVTQPPGAGNLGVAPPPYNDAGFWVKFEPTAGFSGEHRAEVVVTNGAVAAKPIILTLMSDETRSPMMGQNGGRSFAASATVTTPFVQPLRTEVGLTFVRVVNATHGTVAIATDGSWTYTPQPDPQTGEPYMGWDFFQYRWVTSDDHTFEEWIQVNVGGEVLAPPPIITEPQSDWTALPFDGTISQLYTKMTLVQAKRNAVLQKLAALGEAWQTIHQDEDASADGVMAHADIAIAALDAAQSAYLTYLDGWLELTANAATYQNTWQAYIDNVWDSETYGMVLAGVQALPRDIGGLRPNEQYLSQIAAALDIFGDAAGFQSNLASTVFTVTETSHFVLEHAEYGLGLASGGTYTAASMTTKAGLAFIARKVAKNYLVDEIASVALTPVMGEAMAMAQEAGVNPTMLRAGMLSLQATGVLKKAGPRATVMWNADPGGAAIRAIKKGAMRDGERAVLRDRFIALHGPAALADKSAHHMIPLGILDDKDIERAVKRASKANWDISDPTTNGAIVKQYTGSHPQYNADVKDWLKEQMRAARGTE